MKRMMRNLVSLYSMVLICLLGLAACANDDDNVAVSGGEADVYLTLSLRIPGHQSPQTRLTAPQESTIGSLTVLVFKETPGVDDGSPEEKFAYIAPASDFSSGQKVTVKLIPSTEAEEKYSIVLLANAGTPTSAPAVGDAKTATLEKYKFTSAGTWPGAALLPMYGAPEGEAVLINKDTDFGRVSLLRAVARVDVGLNFTETTNGSEEVEGIVGELGETYFSLGNIHVYNSLDRGYIPAYLEMPGDAEVNEPINYFVHSPGTLSARQIYLSEVNNTETSESKNKCCLVIGGYYGADNAAKMTYYRVDFLDANNEKAELDILRNHRYIVNIKKVSGPGFDNPDDAFNAGPMNMIVDVAEWNEDNLTEVEFDGQNYFKSEAKTIIIPFGKESSRTIAVKSNVPLNEWSIQNQAEWFDNLTVDLSENRIVFTAKTEGPMESIVKLRLRNLTIVFTVKQPAGGYFTPEGVFVPDWGITDDGSASVKPDNGGAAPGGGVGSNDWENGKDINGGEIIL